MNVAGAAAIAITIVAATVASAQSAKGLYEISTEGTTKSLAAGTRGKIALEFKLVEGAHLSDDAPMKLEFVGTGLQLDAAKLGRKDGKPGSRANDVRFELGFTPKTRGAAKVDAKLVFFVCTDKACLRETSVMSFDVDVT